RVAFLIAHPHIIIAVECLAHENKVFFYLDGKAPERPKIRIAHTVGNVKAQSVDAIKFDPFADNVIMIPAHIRIIQIQLYKFIVSFPAFIPETVPIVGVAVKVDVEPATVWAVPFLFDDVLKSPKATAYMVEDAVEHNLHAGIMNGLADFLQVFLGSEAGIDGKIVPGVIAVIVALHERIEQHTGGAGLFDMIHPVQYAQNTVSGVFFVKRSTKSQRVDLINDCFVKPHNIFLLKVSLFRPVIHSRPAYIAMACDIKLP